MNAEVFVDTNILIYAAAAREDATEKYERAWEVIGTGEYGISAQVLGEFYVSATRKPAIPLSLAEASQWVARLCEMPVVPIDDELVANAISTSQRYRISYWDGAIVAAAERLGATTLYTEDLNDGQTYGSVTVVNPFREH